jgi:hypothetical protein
MMHRETAGTALAAPVLKEGSPQIDFARLLAAPFANKLLGVTESADLYSKNGFRFVGAAACANDKFLESESQRFKGLFRLNQKTAIHSCIQTGYETHLRLNAEDVKESVARLNNPRYRILFELFWLHISDDLFIQLKNEHKLFSLPLVETLKQQALNQDQHASAIAKHALAVLFHNQAIAQELAFANGKAVWSAEYWQQALFYWSEVFQSEEFWDYLRQRVKHMDDPRIKADEVTKLRQQLPAIILSFNVLFARAYDKAGIEPACRQHLAFIANCDLPETAKQEVLKGIVKLIAINRLDPLIEKINKELLDSNGKFTQQQFEQSCTPFLEQAFQLQNYLVKDLALPEEIVALAEFDRFAEVVSDALNKKLNYDNDDRMRAIFYSALTAKKLLKLPLSTSIRRRLEQQKRNDLEIIYRSYVKLPLDFDPTECYFMPGQDADPEASFDFPIYKITSSKGGNVRWEIRSVIVPRSLRAQQIHNGKLQVQDLPEDELDDDCRAWLAKIREDEAQCAGVVEAEKKAMAFAIEQEEAAKSKALADFELKVDAAVTKDRKELETLKQKHSLQIEPERQKRDELIAQTKQLIGSQKIAAQKTFDETVERNTGMRGFGKLELPILTVTAVIFAGGDWAFSHNFPLVGTIMGIIVGIIIGRGVRSWRIERASSAVQKLGRNLENELKQIEKTFKQTIAPFDKQYEQTSALVTKRLNAVDAERTKLCKTSDQKIKESRRQHEAAIEKVQKETERRVGSWKQSITDRIKGKPESAKNDFPPYKKAKSSNYKDGKGPSDYEVDRLVKRELDDFMYSLSYLEKQGLARLLQVMPADKSATILAALMEMPTYERRRLLEGLSLYGDSPLMYDLLRKGRF